MPEKIAIIGGGSPFVPSLLQTILENKEVLNGSEVWLMDIDPSRLPTLTKLGEDLAGRCGAEVRFAWTTDAREALTEATFVLLGYRIGGVKHMRYDIKIPTKHGICGDETSGPGGTFEAQCTIPATLEYCQLMEELCPDAWVISYVNPANAVADAVRRRTGIRFISICDCFAGVSMSFLPEVLELPPYERRYCVSEDLRPRAIGVNHLTWLVNLQVKGEDGYPLLRERLAGYQKEVTHDREIDFFRVKLFVAFDYVNACPSHDRVYWDYTQFLRERGERKTSEEESVLGWSEAGWRFVEELLAGADYSQHPPLYCFGLYHSRQAIGIMVSIAADEGREWGGINFPNRGAITNLPPEAIVEGPCIVNSRGITPIAMGDLPKAFLGITHHVINWQELTVDAALSGDVKLLYQALLACPYVHDMDAARVIMDELLRAHAEYMPQFKR